MLTRLRDYATLWAASVAGIVLAVVLLTVSPNYRWNSEIRQSPYGSDFLQEWTGANMIASGAAVELYDQASFRRWQHDPQRIGFAWNESEYYPSVYPPPYYLLMAPWTLVSYRVAVWLWLSLLIAAWCASILVIESLVSRRKYASSHPSHALFEVAHLHFCSWIRKNSDGLRNRSSLNSCESSYLFHNNATSKLAVRVSDFHLPVAHSLNQRTSTRSAWFWLVMLLFPATLIGLTMGQKGTLWLFVWAGCWWFLTRNRSFAAGLLFGILSLKPTLFFLVPLLMLRYRQWKFLAGAATMTVAIWGLTAAVLPSNVWWDFYNGVIASTADYQQHGGYELSWSCNLMALVQGTIVADLSYLKWCTLAPLGIAVLGCVAAPKAFEPSDPRMILRWMLATALLSPHFYFYDLVILLVPLRWSFEKNQKSGATLVACLWIVLSMGNGFYASTGIPLLPLVLFAFLIEPNLRRRIATIAALRPITLSNAKLPGSGTL